MKHPLQLCRTALCALVLVFAAQYSSPATADELDDRQLKIKTAMIFNFARFASWPKRVPSATITLCVSSDADLYSSLMSLDGKDVNERTLRAVELNFETLDSCHIGYLSQADARSNIANRLTKSGVLTVSSDRDFSEVGMIELVKIGRQNRFAINNSLAAESGVKLSSKLLRIAVEVR